jgi:hypothetical protein
MGPGAVVAAPAIDVRVDQDSTVETDVVLNFAI